MSILRKLLKVIETTSETTYVKPKTEPKPPLKQAKARNKARDGIVILRWAAMADGHMQEEEYAIIRHYCEHRCAEFGLTADDYTRIIGWVKTLHPTTGDLKKAIHNVAVSPQHAKLIREHVDQLIASDNVIEASEMQAAALIRQFFEEAQAMTRKELEEEFREEER